MQVVAPIAQDLVLREPTIRAAFRVHLHEGEGFALQVDTGVRPRILFVLAVAKEESDEHVGEAEEGRRIHASRTAGHWAREPNASASTAARIRRAFDPPTRAAREALLLGWQLASVPPRLAQCDGTTVPHHLLERRCGLAVH